MRSAQAGRRAQFLLLAGLGVLLAACSSDSAERTSPAAPAATPQAAAPAPPPQSPAAVALAAARSKTREQQKDVISNLILDGVFSQIELQEGVPRVYVRPAYRLLTDKDKHMYLATVYVFAFPEGPGPGLADKVVLIDSVSGEETGTFTEAGLKMN